MQYWDVGSVNLLCNDKVECGILLLLVDDMRVGVRRDARVNVGSVVMLWMDGQISDAVLEW